MICGWVGKWGSLCVMDGSSPTLAALFAKVVIVITTITMVTKHIPTMTKSHHGEEMSVMMKVESKEYQILR